MVDFGKDNAVQVIDKYLKSIVVPYLARTLLHEIRYALTGDVGPNAPADVRKWCDAEKQKRGDS